LKKHLNWIIVGLTVALVAVPVVASQFHAEIARWHLAAAANAVVLKNAGSPEEQLKLAADAYPNIHGLRDTWLFKIKQALASSPNKVVPILEAAISESPENVSLVDYAALKLWSLDKLQEQIKAYELIRSAGKKLTASQLNAVAYARSVVKIDRGQPPEARKAELQQALADIDEALRYSPNEPAFRDTRAWVLFRLDRLEEAFLDADFAVKKLEIGLRGDSFSQAVASVFQYLGYAPEPTVRPEKVLSRAEAGEALWAAGALFYHRAMILTALGRLDEAEKDWQWLSDHGLPDDDTLF
jgi:tetratricopeptide (TPR) repeat protein